MGRAPSFCGVILAAGDSTRMGRPKALLPWRRGTFLGSAIRLLTANTDLVIVVGGRNSKEIEPTVDANAGYLIVNRDPDRGQFSSLQLGLQEVLNRGRDSAIVTLIDRPPALPETVHHLRNEYLHLIRKDQVWAVVPELEGQHGHPIIIGRELIGLIIDAPATSNAREIMHANQSHIAYVPVTDPFVTMNIDTPEDYERVRALSLEPPVTR
jgi:molybdenum cofactor cytidylyltransferase